MPLPHRWSNNRQRGGNSRNRGGKPPDGFEVVEPILEALESELRDKVKETNQNQRRNESVWPVHQINWQKSRYIYDMYYTYNRISKEVYQYCIQQKLVDAALIAKWKKPGYERLCSTYVINPSNYKFNTTSICRVPWFNRSEEQKTVKDPTTGCLGCASGKGAGPRNIFGNKYGQNLAAVQIAREQRREKARKAEEERRRRQEEQEEEDERAEKSADDNRDGDDKNSDNDDTARPLEPGPNNGDDDETDDEDDDDYGPSPAAGIWAGSQKLQAESELLAYGDGGEDETDDDDDEDNTRPNKKTRTD